MLLQYSGYVSILLLKWNFKATSDIQKFLKNSVQLYILIFASFQAY